MFMDDDVQMMELDVLDNKIQGIYSVDDQGNVTFQILNVTGDLEGYIMNYTVLKSN